MKEVLSRYGIEEAFSADVKLSLLEKERQRALRKLNHVFGNPRKERELEKELDSIEAVLTELESIGGKRLSMEEVQLETRKLTQTQLQFSQEEEEMDEAEAAQIERLKKYRKLNAELLADRGQNPQACLEGIQWIADFFEEQGVWSNLETWLSRGIQWAPHKVFFTRLYQLYREKPELVQGSEQKLFYWAKRAAETGDRGACYDLGRFYIKKPWFDLKEAAYYFAKAAGDEYPDAYLLAFEAFYHLKDYKRAEICLLEADKRSIPGAAYRMGAIYAMDENPEGKENPEKSRLWLEKAYRENPDGNVCHALACNYIDADRLEEGIGLLIEGAKAYQDEDCVELLQELIQKS